MNSKAGEKPKTKSGNPHTHVIKNNYIWYGSIIQFLIECYAGTIQNKDHKRDP